MKTITLLAALIACTYAYDGGLAHEHAGGIFKGIAKGVGCSAKDLSGEEPKGKMENIGSGVQAYITSSPSRLKPDTAVIYLSDFFGLPLVNNKLLADSIAHAGFFVVFPDLFAGEPVPLSSMGDPSYNTTAWRLRHPVADIDRIIDTTVAAVKSTYGYKKIGVVGYCLGGKHVARFLAKGKGISAGFMAHPSGLTADELNAIVGPVSIAYADNDAQNPPAQRTLVEQTLNKTKVTWQQTMYSGTFHGFAVRANLSLPQQKFAQESAYIQAIHWLHGWVSA